MEFDLSIKITSYITIRNSWILILAYENIIHSCALFMHVFILTVV
jgi:hypothetical protein